MADIKKRGFKTIETKNDEINEKVLAHRKKILKRAVEIIAIVVALVIIIQLIYALRSFDSYEVLSTKERSSTDITYYSEFNEYLLEYSNDGISCVKNDEIIWNQAFEMSTPQLEMCGDYLAVYDDGGTKIFILTESGLQKEITTSSPIQTVCVAKQGTIAVLMREGDESQVKLFDKKGNELANGKFYGEKGGFPVDIALSYDATKLAVDMIDISSGTVSTTISFYNFGSVGQSEIDNNVGTYTFENIIVPEVDYVSDSKMIAIGTGRILVFDGAQKPEVKYDVAVEQEILSCFHNEKYIGIVYDNAGIENSWHIKVMDMRGKTVMENDISIAYEKIEFLSNNEICVTNMTECEIFTIHSIKKFSYQFDQELLQIFAGDTAENYTFIFRHAVEEVRLK